MKARLLPENAYSEQEQMQLRYKLDNFYAQVTDYTAFQNISDQRLCWGYVGEEIQNRLQTKEKIKVLEIGCGRSGFGKWLSEQGLRQHVYWVGQDVTPQNEEWLSQECDEVFIGDIGILPQQQEYDIVFSTYVFEHVTNPAGHLEKLVDLLIPTGTLFIFCPRYDFLGYICPSAKHLNTKNKIIFMINSFKARIMTFVTGKPAFLIQDDLAAFYKPFYIDADAVHWVSIFDLRSWARNHNKKIERINYNSTKIFTKNWFVKKYLTCSCKIYSVN